MPRYIRSNVTAADFDNMTKNELIEWNSQQKCKKAIVAVYARVSSAAQSNTTTGAVSLRTQLTACLNAAQEYSGYGIEKTAVYVDIGSARVPPGKEAKMLPGLETLINDLETFDYEGLYVHSMDRLTRCTAVFQHIIDVIDDIECGLISVSENLDNTEDFATMKVKILEAQRESERISERIRASTERRRQENQYLGRTAPPGFQIVKKVTATGTKRYLKPAGNFRTVAGILKNARKLRSERKRIRYSNLGNYTLVSSVVKNYLSNPNKFETYTDMAIASEMSRL